MSTMALIEKIGQAWRLHREGDNSGAIRMFDSILSGNPENVDALYGLGLAYKAMNDHRAAADAFRQALDNTERALSAVQITSHAEGHLGDNDLDTDFDDRYMMLTRMLKQRLEDVGASDS